MAYCHATEVCTDSGFALPSTRGVRQGDVLGPALFSLALIPTLKRLKARFPHLHFFAYLDDVSIVGPPQEVVEAFGLLEAAMAEIGLEVNRAKCHAHGYGAEAICQHLGLSLEDHGIPASEGIIILGACVTANAASGAPAHWAASVLKR
jgi:Reverse transcriptase (RNA-dependent DNA polymerase)